MWADRYIQDLKEGRTTVFRPFGNSMTGIIESGQEVTVSPIDRELVAEDVVLCEVGRKQFLHRIVEVELDEVRDPGRVRYWIGNNRGHVNGAISRDKIYGVLVSVRP